MATALSAGSVADPAGRVHPQVVDVMREIDIAQRVQRLAAELDGAGTASVPDP
jgi:hypothetical protein